MSDSSWQKFRGGFSADERFLNIFSVADNFNLIALGEFTPVYKGRNCCEIFLCQHEKIFFKIRQKRYERSYGVLQYWQEWWFFGDEIMALCRFAVLPKARRSGDTCRNMQSHTKAKALSSAAVKPIGRSVELSMNEGASWAALGPLVTKGVSSINRMEEMRDSQT